MTSELIFLASAFLGVAAATFILLSAQLDSVVRRMPIRVRSNRRRRS